MALPHHAPGRPAAADWWRQAVVYQIYPRSFADSDGDGLGDLRGVISRIPYLASLGIDAVWLSPFYPSALADGGYDVDDYRDVDPRLGTLADFDEMTARLHARGSRSSSTSCPTTPPTGTPGSARPWPPRRDRRPGTGTSSATGRARTDPSRPRTGPPVRRPGLDPGPGRAVVPAPVRRRAARPELGQPRGPRRLPDDPAVLVRPRRRRVPRGCGARPGQGPGRAARAAARRAGIQPTGLPHGTHPLWDRDEVHDIYAEWRQVFNEYDPPRAGVAEAWVHPSRRPSTPARTGWDRLSTSTCSKRTGTPESSCGSSPTTSPTRSGSGASTTWVLSNHDVIRHATRYGLPAGNSRHADARAWLLSDGISPRLTRSRPAAGPGRHPADAGAARLRLPLPGRGTRPARGRGHSRRPRPGSRLPALAAARKRAATAAGSRCRGRPTAPPSGSGRRRAPAAAGLVRPAQRPGAGTRPGLYPDALPAGGELAPQAAAAESLEWMPGTNGQVLHFRRPGGWQCVTNFGPGPYSCRTEPWSSPAPPRGRACCPRTPPPGSSPLCLIDEGHMMLRRFIGELTDPMPIGWATGGSALNLDITSLLAQHWRFPNGTDSSRSRGKGVHGRRQGRRRPEPGRPGRRVHGARRAVRLRQVDRAAVDRRAGGDHRRHDPDRRPGRQRPPAEGPGHRDGVPELRAVPAHDGRAEHGASACSCARRPKAEITAPGRRGRQDARPRALPRAASPPRSPAVSGSASRWAARSSANRRCS